MDVIPSKSHGGPKPDQVSKAVAYMLNNTGADSCSWHNYVTLHSFQRSAPRFKSKLPVMAPEET